MARRAYDHEMDSSRQALQAESVINQALMESLLKKGVIIAED